MDMHKEDYLKKALLDTQEKVRDCLYYADNIKDKDIQEFFRECAETEGLQASQLRQFLER